MEGPIDSSVEHEGMIPRAVSQIFLTASSWKDKGWEVRGLPLKSSLVGRISYLRVMFCKEGNFMSPSPFYGGGVMGSKEEHGT